MHVLRSDDGTDREIEGKSIECSHIITYNFFIYFEFTLFSIFSISNSTLITVSLTKKRERIFFHPFKISKSELFAFIIGRIACMYARRYCSLQATLQYILYVVAMKYD